MLDKYCTTDYININPNSDFYIKMIIKDSNGNIVSTDKISNYTAKVLTRNGGIYELVCDKTNTNKNIIVYDNYLILEFKQSNLKIGLLEINQSIVIDSNTITSNKLLPINITYNVSTINSDMINPIDDYTTIDSLYTMNVVTATEGSKSSSKLTDLSDVVITDAKTGDILIYDGDTFVNEPIPEPTTKLVNLTDVIISNPTHDQVIFYDSRIESWVNKDIPTTKSISKIEDLTNVLITDIKDFDILEYSNGIWKNKSKDVKLLEADYDASYEEMDFYLGVNCRVSFVPISNLKHIYSVKLITNSNEFYDCEYYVGIDGIYIYTVFNLPSEIGASKITIQILYN